MNKTVFEVIQENAEALKLDLSDKELAVFADDHELTPEQLESIKELFNYLDFRLLFVCQVLSVSFKIHFYRFISLLYHGLHH